MNEGAEFNLTALQVDKAADMEPNIATEAAAEAEKERRLKEELEKELKTIEPDGRPVSSTTLLQAVAILNQRLRRQGQISAYEIHFNRDMFTGENLNLDYEQIRSDQVKSREESNARHNIKVQENQIPVKTGDVVVVPSLINKHKARDTYIIICTVHSGPQSDSIFSALDRGIRKVSSSERSGNGARTSRYEHGTLSSPLGGHEAVPPLNIMSTRRHLLSHPRRHLPLSSPVCPCRLCSPPLHAGMLLVCPAPSADRRVYRVEVR